MNPIFCGLIVFVIGAIFLQGYRNIPASDPPSVGLRTFLGKITGRVVQSGWHFFLFYPWIQGFILESVETRDMSLSPQKVRTPDQAECKISGKISWVFDTCHPLEFVNSGGDKGIAEKLENIWQGIIREWAVSSVGGPQTYMELIGSGEEAVDLLLKSIVRNKLKKIPSDIPTGILFKYFKKPFPLKPTPSETKAWGAKWQKVGVIIQKEIADGRYQDAAELEQAVKERRGVINDVRQGRGKFEKSEWGILIQLLNLTEPEPLGELAKAMELQTKEAREEAADKTEIANFRKRSAELREDGREIEAADEIVYIERGKATKEIKKHEISLSPETKSLLEGILQKILKP